MPPQKGAEIVLFHAETAGNLPPVGSLKEGELALDALSNPARLWTQVPTSRDPSGRIDLLAQGAGITLPLAIADGGTGSTTANGAVTNLGGPWAIQTNPTGGQNNYAPLAAPTFTGSVTLPTTVTAPLTRAYPTGSTATMVFLNSGTGGDNQLKALEGFGIYDSGNLGMTLTTSNATGGAAPYFNLTHTRGTLAAPTPTQSGDYLGTLNFHGNPMTAGVPNAGISVTATQTFTATARGSALAFAITPTGSATSYDAMRIQFNNATERYTQLSCTNAYDTTQLAFRSGSLTYSSGTNNAYCGFIISNNQAGSWWEAYNNNPQGYPYLNFTKGRGTAASPTATQSGDILCALGFSGHPPSTITYGGVNSIQVVATANYTSTVAPARMDFLCIPAGQGVQQVCASISSSGTNNARLGLLGNPPRFYIDAWLNSLSIGAATMTAGQEIWIGPGSAAGPAGLMDISATGNIQAGWQLRCNNGVVFTGAGFGTQAWAFLWFSNLPYLYINGAQMGYWNLTPSDELLKSNISPIKDDSLAELCAVHLRSFDQRNLLPDSPTEHHPIGFIAQQLEQIMPDTVTEAPRTAGSSGMLKSVKLLPLLARCVRAIQQLEGRLAALERN